MSIEREIRFTLYGRDFEHIALKQILGGLPYEARTEVEKAKVVDNTWRPRTA